MYVLCLCETLQCNAGADFCVAAFNGPSVRGAVLQVPSDMKKGMVKGVFTSVAHNYDVMNDLMSAGGCLPYPARRCHGAP